MPEENRLRWGIIGTGRIASIFASELPLSATGRLLAVGSRDEQSAKAFAGEHGAERFYGSYDELLADADVDAVYISTPHPMHARWAVRAAEAGKHVLCEKPLALNLPEAMAVVEAARREGVFLMEAFMYRCHPQTERLVQLLGEGAIGEVKAMQASFGFAAGYDPDSRLFSPSLGGGGILDVGCYTVSMAQLVARATAGEPGHLGQPSVPKLSGTGRIAPSGVDEVALASLAFDGGLLAQLACGVGLTLENSVRIFGTAGQITLGSPWLPGGGREQSVVFLHRAGQGAPEEIRIEATPLYAAEADMVARHIGAREAPCMPVAETLANMAVLDAWRQAVGVSYPMEAPDAAVPTISGRPLSRRSDARIPCGEVPGVGKPVSRLVLGIDNQASPAYLAVMCDDWVERGGNCFDTAHIYGDGRMERLLGTWLAARGVRDQIVIIGKGAHTPDCNPDALTSQLLESLDNLRSDHVDLYLMHRDNPEVPVGEFVEVLNEHLAAGRIRAFGGSNWSIGRFEEANSYAAAHGLQPMVALSNHFSLARMNQAPWPGCLSVGDPESRAWLQRTQVALFPWSSQAHGFFAGRSGGVTASWEAPDNESRRERVRHLAARRGTSPSAVALAYVLCQPFPTFPLIGPRALSETTDSLRALDVALEPEDLAWLRDG